MSALPRTYRFLAGLEDGAVDEALAAGARELDGPYLRFAVEVLLQRGRPEGLSAVVDDYHRLPADLQKRVVASEAAISPLLRTTVRSYELQTRLNAMEIASRIGSESLAYLLDMGLLDSNPKVRELASSTMRQMAVRLLGDHPLLGGERGAGNGPRVTGNGLRVTGNGSDKGNDRATATADKGTSRQADKEQRREQGAGNGLRVTGDGLRVTGDGSDKGDDRVTATADKGTGRQGDEEQRRGAGGGNGKDSARGYPDLRVAAPSILPSGVVLLSEMATAGDESQETASIHGGVAEAAGATEPLAKLAQRRQHLFEALLSAAMRYESHLRSEAVEACMWFEPYLGERFWGLLGQSRSKLPRLVADLLIQSDEAPAAYLLMQAMSVAEMRPQAVKAISERRDPKWFRAALRGVEMWHAWPRVRRAWNYIKEITYLYTLDEGGWAELGDTAASAILIAASNPGLQNKTMLMERLLSGARSPACRRQILLEASRGKDWGLPLLEKALQESNDPAEARMAAYGLLAVGHEGLVGTLVKRLSRPGDTAPAGLMELAADLVFWRLWTRFDTMEEERRVAGLAGIKGFAGYIKDRLRVNLASASTSHRLRAARIVGLLGLVDILWKDMRLAAQDSSARVRSAAVRFLGRSSRPELRQQLLAALEDPDGRVQANALEAMDEAGWPDLLALIVPKLHSDHNRVRANAVKVLARAGDEQAGRILVEMLEDGRAEYRVAAIWTIKQIGAGAWLDRLAQLAEHDPSASVRRQAQAVYKEIQAGQGAAEKVARDGGGTFDPRMGPGLDLNSTSREQGMASDTAFGTAAESGEQIPATSRSEPASDAGAGSDEAAEVTGAIPAKSSPASTTRSNP